jgi:hypothetical protein
MVLFGELQHSATRSDRVPKTNRKKVVLTRILKLRHKTVQADFRVGRSGVINRYLQQIISSFFRDVGVRHGATIHVENTLILCPLGDPLPFALGSHSCSFIFGICLMKLFENKVALSQ